MKVDNQTQIGFSLKEYENIGRISKPPLPLRCTITLECERAKGTRWLFTREMKTDSMLFEYELVKDEGYTLNPTMMKIHQTTYPKEFLTDIDNACPEVVFEYYGIFAERYYKYKDYDWDGQIKFKQFETQGKHFSQCHEFANWLMMNTDKYYYQQGGRIYLLMI